MAESIAIQTDRTIMTEKVLQTDPQVFQFKVTMAKVWRKIQISADSDFRELHFAIQSAMGWRNCHLYQFKITKKKVKFVRPPPGQSHEDRMRMLSDHLNVFEVTLGEVQDGEVQDGDYITSARTVKLSKWFPLAPEYQIEYTYDLGQCWDHRIVLEKTLPAVKGEKYPKCIAGRNPCPPEDGVYSDSDDEPDPDVYVFDPKSVDFDSLDKNPFGY